MNELGELKQAKILKLEKLQQVLDSGQFAPANVSYEHYFADGMYCRAMNIPAGVMAVGAIHKKEHFGIVAKGTLILVDGDSDPVTLTAGSIVEAFPGVKRAVFALEDSKFVNVTKLQNPTERDLDTIWDETVCNTLNDYLAYTGEPCLLE